jgi:hypothetical protein
MAISSIATLVMQPTAVPSASCWLLLPLPVLLLVVIGHATIEGVPRSMNFSAYDFEYLGFEIVGSKKRQGTAFALCHFKGHFGVTPQIAAIVWCKLFLSNCFQFAIRPPRPEHLLWCVLFLKNYSTEEIHATVVGTSEKTF